jgi:hypothetical protein
MSDPFKEFVEEMARLAVPADDTEESRERREAAASESGTPISELDESDLVASADDEFLCSETLALWAMIRKARELVRQAQLPQRIQTDGLRLIASRLVVVAGPSELQPHRRARRRGHLEDRNNPRRLACRLRL